MQFKPKTHIQTTMSSNCSKIEAFFSVTFRVKGHLAPFVHARRSRTPRARASMFSYVTQRRAPPKRASLVDDDDDDARARGIDAAPMASTSTTSVRAASASAVDDEHARTTRDMAGRKRALDRISFVIMTCALWAMLRFMCGEMLAPNGPATTVSGGGVWAVTLIWACAHIGGAVAVGCKLPSLIGMLVFGLVLRNVPGNLVDDLPERWSSDIRAAGLSVILMRSGLELDLDAFKSIGWMASRLTVMPGLTEAIAVGLFSMLVFNMGFPMGMCLGFILGAVSPAVVVLGMFELQSRGYGVTKGIPSLVVAAASFDDVVAITGYTIFKSFALGASHGGNMAWTVMHGPTDVVMGLIAGSCGGVLCGLTVLWDTRWKRSSMVFMLGMFFMFIGRSYGFNGGGAMASLALGISANKFWSTGKPIRKLSTGPSFDHAHGVETDLAMLWRVGFQPLLFGVIGSAVKFEDITPSTIPKSIGLLLIGLSVRLPMAFFAVGGGKGSKKLTFIERLFIALAWVPKATVQAALASDPLDFILEHGKSDKYVKWGNDILTTAVFSIILTAPLGMIIISTLGPKWLTRDGKKPIESGELMERVEQVRRNSIEAAAATLQRRSSMNDDRNSVSIPPDSPRTSMQGDRDREGSVVSVDEFPRTATASEKLIFHLTTLREMAIDSPDLSPEDVRLIEDASESIENIMREHLPRVRSIDTPGLFFRRTSATFNDLDIPPPGEFDDIVAEVETFPARDADASEAV